MKLYQKVVVSLVSLVLLSSSSYAEHIWVGLYNQNSKNEKSSQSVVSRDTIVSISNAIETEWSKGYFLIDLEQGKRTWMAVFSKTSGYTSQALYHSGNWTRFEKVMAKKVAQGFSVIDFRVWRW